MTTTNSWSRTPVDNDSESKQEWYHVPPTTILAKEASLRINQVWSRIPDEKQMSELESQEQFDRVEPFFSPHPTRFYGTMASSLMKSDIPKMYLGDVQYVASPKSNGTRYQCLFFRLQKDYYTVFRNRSGQWFTTAMNPLPSFFWEGEGTIWEGDLLYVASKRRWEFHIYENIATGGQFCARQFSYLERLQIAQWSLEASGGGGRSSDQRWVRECNTWLYFHVKPVFHLIHAKYLVEYIKNCGYSTDGIVFTPVDQPIVRGTHSHLWKWKQGTDHTVDFRVVGNSSRLMIYDAKQKKEVDSQASLLLPSCLPHSPSTSSIAECRWEATTKKWKFDRWRPDRAIPNKRSTWERTMQNINENLSLQDDVLPFLKQPTLSVPFTPCIRYGEWKTVQKQRKRGKGR